MSTISSIISTLSNEEKRAFVASLRKKNKRNDTKNIQLFKLLNTADPPKDIDIVLYGKPSKGAFHALSKRLHDSLIDFIASKSFEGETSEEMEILKLLLASRIFFEQKQYKIAFKTLDKAEQKAKNYDLYGILNEIYYTKIQYAHLNTKIILEVLIANFKKNKDAIQQEENLNLFYASVQNELSQHRQNFVIVIQNALSRFGISTSKDLTFRSLFKILEVTNKTAQVSRDYYSILAFVEEVYTQISTKEEIINKHLFYHIQIIYYVANAHFRNKNFATSQHYLKLMLDQMQKHQQKYHRRFLPQYILLNTLNLNYTGYAEEAIQKLETFNYNKHKEQVSYTLDLKLSLIVFYFMQSKFKDALHILNGFYHSDHWYTEKAGMLWVIKKNLVEILVHLELDHIDLIESRVNSFRKKHRTYLQKNSDTRALEFLKLILEYYHTPEIIVKDTFKTKINKTLATTSRKQEDIFEMSFYAWLKSKAGGTKLYKTILEMVKQ